MLSTGSSAVSSLRLVADGMLLPDTVLLPAPLPFHCRRDRLARLEERFAGMVEAPLTAAFTKQQGGWGRVM